MTPRGQDGFSTLETIIAFVILSMMLTATSQLVAGAARNLAKARTELGLMREVREAISRYRVMRGGISTTVDLPRTGATLEFVAMAGKENLAAVYLRRDRRSEFLTFVVKPRHVP